MAIIQPAQKKWYYRMPLDFGDADISVPQKLSEFDVEHLSRLLILIERQMRRRAIADSETFDKGAGI